jgi:hypothetical protein
MLETGLQLKSFWGLRGPAGGLKPAMLQVDVLGNSVVVTFLAFTVQYNNTTPCKVPVGSPSRALASPVCCLDIGNTSSNPKPCQLAACCLPCLACLQGYHPSLVLVSKQALLSLSPLHHQLLPPPEVAHLLPSSFAPAVGKALMQQVFDSPVLDAFEYEHPSGRLQLYHVWWHVGLRVYARRQQVQQAALRQQQQQQGDVPGRNSGKNQADCNGRQHNSSTSSSKGKNRRQRDQRQVKPSTVGSKGSSRSSCELSTANSQQEPAPTWQALPSSELEALYLNPEARWAGGCPTAVMTARSGHQTSTCLFVLGSS